MRIKKEIITVETQLGISIFDISSQVNASLEESGIKNGFVIVGSRHTTTAVTINEYEERLLKDIRAFFTRQVPPGDKYLHNDIHLRDCAPDEPENAHSHLITMLLGASESIPVTEAKLDLGQYQSVMLIELDGPRTRQVNIQVIGE